MHTTLKHLILIALVTLLHGCDKKNTEHFEFTSAYMSQTRWQGTLETVNVPELGDIYNYKVGVFFVSDKSGGFSLFKDNSKERASEENFEYSITNKIMSIKGGGYLHGIWFCTHFDGKKMILEEGKGGEGAYKATLKLTKVD